MKSAREWFRATLLVRDYLEHWKLYISLAREIVPRDSALSTTSEPNEDRTPLCTRPSTYGQPQISKMSQLIDHHLSRPVC